MKLAPSILKPPSITSGSLYFYKGVRIQPGTKDPELAEVYFRRVTVARAATTEARTRWQQKVASETSPEPCVLKSKWKVKRAISADNVLNNVESLRAKLRKNRCRQKLESESVDLNLNLHVELAASQSSRALWLPFCFHVSIFAAFVVAFGQQVAHRRSALMRLSSQVALEVVCINRIIMTLDADCFHYLFYCTIYFNSFSGHATFYCTIYFNLLTLFFVWQHSIDFIYIRYFEFDSNCIPAWLFD